jgi:uncharacterized protein
MIGGLRGRRQIRRSTGRTPRTSQRQRDRAHERMIRYFRLVLRHRLAVLLACAALSAVAALALRPAVLASSLGQLMLGEDPAYYRYLERVRQFSSDEVFLVAIEELDLLAPGVLGRFERALDGIRAIPEVGRVESLISVQHIEGDADELRVETLAEVARTDPGRVPSVLEALRSDAFARGLLVSDDGRDAAILVELIPDQGRAAERTPHIVDEALGCLEREGFAADRMHRAGFLAAMAEVIVQTRFSLERLFPLVALVLLLTVYALFRRLWPVALTLGVSMIAVLWTMALAVTVDPKVNVLLAMVPAVVLIVAFSDIIHLCSAYLIELGHGKPKDRAILDCASDVGLACWWTSVTTCVGFMSLALVPVPAFRQLGLVLGFGVAVALLLAMTLVPIAFSLLPEPKPWRVGTAAGMQNVLDRLLSGCRLLAAGRPWLVLLGFTAVLGLCVLGLTRLRIETDFVRRLEPDNPVRLDSVYFEQRFAGTNFLDLYVEASEPEGLLDPELFARIAAYQQAVEALPQVDRVVSLVDLVRTLHRELALDALPGELPRTRSALAQELLLFEGAGEELERLVDFERRTMRLAVRLRDSGVRASYQAGQAAQALAGPMLGGTVQVEATGLSYVLGGWLDEILFGQLRGLILSIVTIGAMMVLALGSVRAGLWSMPANLLPLLAVGGWVGMFWGEVDSDTIMVGMLAIGIGVDDTIHFLSRYRIESLRAGPDEALRRTFDFCGRAIVMTTVILVLGFSPFLLSDYFSTKILGSLLPLALIVALVTDLLMLPALARVGWLHFGRR